MGSAYAFRVSAPGATKVSPDTPLVDRVVLDGMANRLIPALDLRYRRSRQSYVVLQPQSGWPLPPSIHWIFVTPTADPSMNRPPN